MIQVFNFLISEIPNSTSEFNILNTQEYFFILKISNFYKIKKKKKHKKN